MGAGPRTVDCVFTMLSPWAYLGHAAFMDVCRRRNTAARFRAVSLSAVFPASGGLPLAMRHPSRQSYRLVELQRWRDRRGLAFDLHPPFWPFDPALADRAIVALTRAGRDPEGFVAAGFRAVWEHGRDLARADEIERLLAGSGHDAGAVMEAARSGVTAAAYAEDTRHAIAQGVFGSPTYLLDGEIFWGQDRLDLLDDALGGGRAPYTARGRDGSPSAALPVAGPIV